MMLCENMYKVYTNMDTHRNSRVCSPLTRLRVSTSSCSFMSHLSPVFKDVDPGAKLSQGASQQCHPSAVGSWASHVISPSQISSEKGWKKKNHASLMGYLWGLSGFIPGTMSVRCSARNAKWLWATSCLGASFFVFSTQFKKGDEGDRHKMQLINYVYKTLELCASAAHRLPSNRE